MPTRPAGPRLASVSELESPPFRAFMTEVNGFAALHGLRQFTNWSKVWEYPWLQFHGLGAIDWAGRHLVDLGSEISPLPWMIAAKGGRATLIEADPQWVPVWTALRDTLGVDVSWHVVSSETLPLADASADAVTSFSVIEHQPDKRRALNEIARVLTPGAPLFLSFDICEPEMGMTFPEWNGRALTMKEFEEEVWRHPDFDNGVAKPAKGFGAETKPSAGFAAEIDWNVADIETFKAWHLQSAAHHNYVTAAAVLGKKT